MERGERQKEKEERERSGKLGQKMGGWEGQEQEGGEKVGSSYFLAQAGEGPGLVGEIVPL